MKINRSRTSRIRSAGLIAAVVAALASAGVGTVVASAQTTSTTAGTTATTAIKSVALPFGNRGGPRGGFGAHANTIASALGITTAQLRSELESGKTIAQVASARGVDLAKVIDALVAEEVLEHPEVARADIVARVTNMVNGVRPAPPADGMGGGHGRGGRGGPGDGRGPGRGFGAHGDTIASALGITTAQLRSELESGKTIAQVASARGVDLAKVIDAFVADEVLEHPEVARADIVARVTNKVNGVRPARPGGAMTTAPAAATKSISAV